MSAAPVHQAVTERVRARDLSWNFIIPFALVHLGCFAAIWTGVSWQTLTAAFVLYALRMFGITAGYHRLYSHRSYYIPSKALRCVMWFLATSSAQRHVRWWASHHRHHHRHSDTEHDLHALVVGTMWAHMGWQYHATAAAWDDQSLRDFDKAFPELRTIDRFAWVSPLALVAACWALWGAEERPSPSAGARWRTGTSRSPSTRSTTYGAPASSIPKTPAKTTCGWRCCRLARGGTTTTTPSSRRAARVTPGGRST